MAATLADDDNEHRRRRQRQKMEGVEAMLGDFDEEESDFEGTWGI